MSNKAAELKTKAEATQYKETSRHSDVLSFIESLTAQNLLIHQTTLGKSGEGQDMAALIISDRNCFTPEEARNQKKMVVMVEANIHSGEVEGKEATLALARDLTLTGLDKALLSQLCLVFIPNFNPDGNDRISPSNRKLNLKTLEGQVNPEGGVGTRYTGEGWNLNRDAMKQEAVETKNLARFYQYWQPDAFIDCHTTDGSLHGFDLTFDTSRSNQHLFGNLLTRTKDLLESTNRRIESEYGYRGFWYGNFPKEEEPTSGWHTYPALPRFGSHYRGLLGKIDVLLETYSYISFEKRCKVTYAWLLELFRTFAQQKDMLLEAISQEKAHILERGTKYKPQVHVGINYGVAYRDEQGALLFDYPAYQTEGDVAHIVSYDKPSLIERIYPGKQEQLYQVPHFRTFLPVTSVTTPAAYLVPASLAEKLNGHGIAFEPLSQETKVSVQAYHILAMEKTFSPDVAGMVPPPGQAEIPLSLKPPPKRFETVLTVRAERHTISVPAGTLVVKTAQPTGTLAVYLLEPHSDDGFTRWEFLDPMLKVGQLFPISRVLHLEDLSSANPPVQRKNKPE